MTDQKGALDAIQLVIRLYTHLKHKGELRFFVDFLSQIEWKAKQVRNGSGKQTTKSSANNYWSEVETTIRHCKQQFLQTPRDFLLFLEDAERKLLLHIPQSTPSSNQEKPAELPISQHIIKGGKISVIGLDRAGKTSILQRLRTGRWIANSAPTIGMNADTLIIGNVKFTAWDLGGQIQYRRALWEMYTRNSVGLIFVVDGSDPRRYPEARLTLQHILSLSHLENLPLAVFVNKIDLIDQVDETDLLNILGISKTNTREIKVFQTSAKTGVGIKKGVYWLSDIILFRRKDDKDFDDFSPSPFNYNPPSYPKGPPSGSAQAILRK